MNNTSLFLFISVLFIIGFFIAIHICNKRNNTIRQLELDKQKLEVLKIEELKDHFRREWEDEQRKLDYKKRFYTAEIETNKIQLENQYELAASKYTADIDKLKVQLQEKEKRYNEVNQDLDLYRQGKMNEIDTAAKEYEKRKQLLITQSIDTYRNRQMSMANIKLEMMQFEKEEAEKEIKEIKASLEEERSKRAAVNEEIRKQEEKEKYNEIHSVNLTDNEKEDIHFLLSLEERLHNKQALYKLVWSTYLQQAYKNTFHNILGNKDPKNVIYCIENINTGKKYIGKTSAEVSKRWTEHIKTSLNIGSIKSTNIHKALYNHWDEFIFYIIAETEKEKLSELEKYYIKFYESDKYGYNIKAGG